MADDDQPSSDIDIDPSKPEGPPITAEGKPVVPVDKPDPPSASSQSIEQMESDLLKFQMDMMKRNQERDQRIDAQVAPMKEALLKEMAQPAPQAPSMSEASPYGNQPPTDPQTQRGNFINTLFYGLIGLGLAKVFAGRNKSAYYGALDGIGEALRQRNAGQQQQANQSFDRWVKLQELWHQQLRDRVQDYHDALENRKFNREQKLEAIKLISNLHGNIQTEAAAGRGDMQSVHQMIEQLDKMRIGQQDKADKMAASWFKERGTTDMDRAYDNFLRGEGVHPENRAEYEAAQRPPALGKKDLRYMTFFNQSREKDPTTGQKTPVGQGTQEDINRHIDEKIDGMLRPAAPQGAATPAGSPTSYVPSGGGLLPGSEYG